MDIQQYEDFVKRFRDKDDEKRSVLRTNVGFIIIASRRNRAGEEIVLGFNPESNLYVTWLCLGGYDYNHGHYEADFFKAVEDFKRRSER